MATNNPWRRRMALLCLLLPVCCLTVYAGPLSDFSFTYTGTDVSAAGVLLASDNGDGSYEVMGISGTRNGDPILALIPAGGFQVNDNLLFYPGVPHLDFGGISYSIAAGDVNLYYGGGEYYEFSGEATPEIAFRVGPPTAPLPEPAPGVLVGCGLAGCAVFAFSRRAARRRAL